MLERLSKMIVVDLEDLKEIVEEFEEGWGSISIIIERLDKLIDKYNRGA